MPVALATKDSCPWCTEPDELSLETLPGDAVLDGHPIGVCLECGSPISLSKDEPPARITEAEARNLLSADEWDNLTKYQRFARCLTPERRAILLAQIESNRKR